MYSPLSYARLILGIKKTSSVNTRCLTYKQKRSRLLPKREIALHQEKGVFPLMTVLRLFNVNPAVSFGTYHFGIGSFL